MLIDEIIKFCDNEYKKLNHETCCDNCTYKTNCPHRCDRCLHYIHTPSAAPAPRKYDCRNMAFYYTCKYSYKYMSELVYAFKQLNAFKEKDQLRILSFGCGPCTDLFAIDYLRENGIYKFDALEYRGIDLEQDVWGNIHSHISENSSANYEIKFYYYDVTSFIDTIIDSDWIPDLIIFQYVLSDMEKHCEKVKLNGLISKTAKFFNDILNDDSYIVLNDINLSVKYGGGREYFDNLLKQLVSASFKRYHFDNSNKTNHYDYGNQYPSNSLIIEPPEFLNYYEPYVSCASAQMLIKKERK